MNKRIFLAAAVMGLGTVGCVALPLPIQNGVLTGNLNANGQALTNVGSVTFGDGTMLVTGDIWSLTTNYIVSGSNLGASWAAGTYVPCAPVLGTNFLYNAAGGVETYTGRWEAQAQTWWIGQLNLPAYVGPTVVSNYVSTLAGTVTCRGTWYPDASQAGGLDLYGRASVIYGYTNSFGYRMQTTTGDGSLMGTTNPEPAVIYNNSTTLTGPWNMVLPLAPAPTVAIVWTTEPPSWPAGTWVIFGASGLSPATYGYYVNTNALSSTTPPQTGWMTDNYSTYATVPTVTAVLATNWQSQINGPVTINNTFAVVFTNNPAATYPDGLLGVGLPGVDAIGKSGGQVWMGDYMGDVNDTYVYVDDQSEMIRMAAANGIDVNGQAVTNVGSITFADGTVQSTAGGGNVQYGGPMMFDYANGITNIVSDGHGDVTVANGGLTVVEGGLTVESADSGTAVFIGPGTISCYGSGWPYPGYQGALTDNMGSQGTSGNVPTANGDGTWTWGNTLSGLTAAGLSVGWTGVTNTIGNVVATGIATEIVSGAGTADANDIYYGAGQVNGKPGYQGSAMGCVINWIGGSWVIMELDDFGFYLPIYESYSDTPTPDLATDWFGVNGGVGPFPNFTAVPAGFVGNGAGLTGLSASQISGLGSLALSNTVPASKVAGLGNLAFSNSITATQVFGLGSLAYSNSTAGLNLVVTNTWNGAQTRTYFTNGLLVKFTAP